MMFAAARRSSPGPSRPIVGASSAHRRRIVGAHAHTHAPTVATCRVARVARTQPRARAARASMIRTPKPKNQRAKRVLEHRAPKLVENRKRTLLLRGPSVSELGTNVLRDLFQLKKPDAVMLHRKNAIRPFEDATSLEFLAQKNDAALFAFVSHNKKRPHNLVLGRMYDFRLLDAFELGIARFAPMREHHIDKFDVGAKPALVFSGDFDGTPEAARLKSLLIDFFRGAEATGINLVGLQHVLYVHLGDGLVHVRGYRILLRKSGTRVPRVELAAMGPDLVRVRCRSVVGPCAPRGRSLRTAPADGRTDGRRTHNAGSHDPAITPRIGRPVPARLPPAANETIEGGHEEHRARRAGQPAGPYPHGAPGFRQSTTAQKQGAPQAGARQRRWRCGAGKATHNRGAGAVLGERASGADQKYIRLAWPSVCSVGQ